jgi:hypothetical protein
VVREVIRKFRGDNTTRSVPRFLRSYKRYLGDGRKMGSHQRLLRSAFTATSGSALDVAAAMAREHYGKFELGSVPPADWNLLNIGPDDHREASRELLEKGWWISPHRVEETLLDIFEKDAMARVGWPAGSAPEGKEMLHLDQAWVLSQHLTQALMLDPGAYQIAGEYLRVDPVLSLADSWFSFPVEKISPAGAQNWHWDCDRVRWLKVFVYLTDVDEASGPHAFVQGSHTNLRMGSESSRYSNAQIFEKYQESDEKIFTAPRGTVIFEDTRGLHRGTPLITGHRLVLQVEYAVDHYGYGVTQSRFPVDLATRAKEVYPRLLR